MGGVFGSTKSLREALEISNLDTPSKTQQRLINPEFDPRSPSTGVVRTPIVVTTTPNLHTPSSTACTTPNNAEQTNLATRLDLDPRSPSNDYPRTPIVVPKIDESLDPRSPSTDYIRTPIQSLTSRDRALDAVSDDVSPLLEIMPPLQQIDDPRSPAVAYIRTPIINERQQFEGPSASLFERNALLETPLSDSIPNIESIPAIPELGDHESIITRSQSEPDLNKDNVQLIRRRNVPESNSFRESTPKKTKTMFHQVLSHEDLTPKSVKVKDMSPLALTDNPRSPLSVRNIDVNSPRVMVQRKQKTKLNLSMKVNKIRSDAPRSCAPRSPSKLQAFNIYDKENRIDY